LVSSVGECINLCYNVDDCNYVTYLPSDESQFDSCGLFGYCALATDDCGGCTSWEKACVSENGDGSTTIATSIPEIPTNQDPSITTASAGQYSTTASLWSSTSTDCTCVGPSGTTSPVTDISPDTSPTPGTETTTTISRPLDPTITTRDSMSVSNPFITTIDDPQPDATTTENPVLEPLESALEYLEQIDEEVELYNSTIFLARLSLEGFYSSAEKIDKIDQAYEAVGFAISAVSNLDVDSLDDGTLYNLLLALQGLEEANNILGSHPVNVVLLLKDHPNVDKELDLLSDEISSAEEAVLTRIDIVKDPPPIPIRFIRGKLCR